MYWRDRKKDKKKQAWVSVFLALLMIFSAFGVYLSATSEPQDKYEYGKHKLQFREGKYWLKVDQAEIPFYHLPQDIEFVNLSKEASSLIKAAWIPQIVLDPSQDYLEYVELTRFEWSRWWGKPVLNGVTKASEIYPSLPVITCMNATQRSPVIYLNSSISSSAELQGSCLILNGLGVDFLRWRDRILYIHLGIMES